MSRRGARRRVYQACAFVAFYSQAVVPNCFADDLRVDHIPMVTTTSLNGQTLSLPELFHNKPAILVVGFSPDSKEQARLWSKQLIEADLGRSNVYGLVMLDRVPRLLRSFVLHEIRKDVAASFQFRFLIITNDDQQWRKLAGVQSLQDAYLLVVDGQGLTRWRSHESFSVIALARTREALRQAEFVN